MWTAGIDKSLDPKSQIPDPNPNQLRLSDLGFQIWIWDLPAASLRSVAGHHEFLRRLRPNRRCARAPARAACTRRREVLELDGVKPLLRWRRRAGSRWSGTCCRHRPRRAACGSSASGSTATIELHRRRFGEEVPVQPDFDVVSCADADERRGDSATSGAMSGPRPRRTVCIVSSHGASARTSERVDAFRATWAVTEAATVDARESSTPAR